MAGRGRFVGIGIDSYPGTLSKLDHAVADVAAVAELLANHFDGEPLKDASTAAVTDHLESLAEQGDGVGLVLMWSGHGVDTGELRLPTADKARGIAAHELVSLGVEVGAAQMLFILDTCQAGAAVLDATQLASRLMERMPRRVDLVDDDAVTLIRDQAGNGGQWVVADALLRLASVGREETLMSTMDALDDPSLFSALLASVAGDPAADSTLGPVAVVAYLVARDSAETADAGFYLAIANAISTDSGDEGDLLNEALEVEPERRGVWLGWAVDLAATHTRLLPLIKVLAERS